MPFSSETIQLVGGKLNVEPEYGFGWRLSAGDEHIQDFDVPAPFEAELAEVLFDLEEARAVLAKIDLELQGRRFLWGYFVPRTDSVIDLKERSVTCNILLSETKPYLSENIPYPDPKHVWTDSKIQLRGSGRVSLIN